MQIAITPGSFDPLTRGHLDIIERAADLYDKVIVSVGVNPSKKPFLPIELRVKSIEAATDHLKNVEVTTFQGLLVQHATEQKAQVIVRGLRATSDFDYEFQIAMANRRLAPSIETVFLMTKWEHSYLSSSVVREVATLGGDYHQFIPDKVYESIKDYVQTLRV